MAEVSCEIATGEGTIGLGVADFGAKIRYIRIESQWKGDKCRFCYKIA